MSRSSSGRLARSSERVWSGTGLRVLVATSYLKVISGLFGAGFWAVATYESSSPIWQAEIAEVRSGHQLTSAS